MRGIPNVLAAAFIMSALIPTVGSGHQVGPGERKSPAKGTHAVPPYRRAKDKSASLKKLLRK